MDLQLRVWARQLAHLNVHQAMNGTEAIAIAKEHSIDLAFVDLFLGHENGMDVVRELKALDPEMHIVAVSADMTVAYAMALIRAGADDVYVKPLECARIVQNVEKGLPLEMDWVNSNRLTLEEVEWEHISRVLVECDDNITQAAERLGIYRQTLQRKLRKRGRESIG